MEQRLRAGDGECDLVMSKTGKECIFTVVDRCSRFLFSGKLEDKTATKLADAMVAALEAYEWHTLTFDNGKEFARHIGIARALGAKSYFAHPYSSWERAQNERHNRIFREFVPKGRPICSYSADYILEASDRMNATPRKSLDYHTPEELFKEQIAQLLSAT